ncbi:MAG TPA: dTDP-4-amino-4,6-dideoxygalactose transaminase [Eubacteriaceae bacterium]|nr:dTDP-4-amino-4,6-dideoxygalactose transaminase [Eubacteriaceae bacterium]
MNIPFHQENITDSDRQALLDALETGKTTGDGVYTKKVARRLQEITGSKEVLMTTSASHALEMAMMLIDIREGDEVILPSFTFPSTANCIVLRGGKPIFCDINSDTLMLDAYEVEKVISQKTKAILVVHYGGNGCDMDEMVELAEKHGLFLIEDAAQALGACYKDRMLGTFGHLGCFSFHGTKNVSCGEGGCLLINSVEGNFVQRAYRIRQKGTNRREFLEGQVDFYNWVDLGSSYAPSDLLMALLNSQLDRLEEITQNRRETTEQYQDAFSPYLKKGVITHMTQISKNITSNYHNFYLRLRTKEERDSFIEKTRQAGVCCVIHFMPLHSSPMGRQLGYDFADLPKTIEASDTLVRLPLYHFMTEKERKTVIDRITEILEELCLETS